ncbi:Zinc finger protein 423 like protein [Argiope bruennichi]|uniref:Zinc finger protein 423 like protein n=1 Tax=Argiope bruennichi TaxID=94029 RepID=A0A8T0EHI1_ARGBR|nr:Zinc finger protein 423 like protein [Argiope bruennichi]
MKYFGSSLAKRGSNCGGGSSDTPDSLSPGDCPTPTDSELSYTVGVTENTPYGCQFCDKAFPRLSYLKRHEQIHSDQMPFRCDYCQRLFKHKRSRDRHVKLHTGDRKYRCTQCESAFSRSDHLKIHMKTHDNGKPYQCTVCNRGYNTAAALSSHMQNHKKISEQNADLPVAPYTRGSTPNEQQGDKDGREDDSPDPPKPLLCNFCPQVCSSPNALGDHVLQSHRSFSSSSPLSESPRPPSSRSCFKCLDELASPNAVCPHRKSHGDTDTDKSSSDSKARDGISPTMKLTCGFCSKSDFPTFESLQLHVQVLHVPTGSAADSALAASIRSLQSMLHGKRPHHGQSMPMDNFMGYGGIDCESSLSALHMLQKHAAMGENLMLKRPNDIYCSQCNIGFTSSAALLDHVHLVHENTNPSVSRSPSSPINNHSSKRSYASSRLRPNGAKHLKTSTSMVPHSAVFNGTSNSHYRRQDPGGGQNLSSGHSPDTSPNTLLCSQCNAGFSDFESFRTHLKSHLDAAAAASTSGQGPVPVATSSLQLHTCPECNAEFSTEALLDSHVIGHFLSASTEYGCPSCMKLFQKPDELQKHLMDVHAYHLYRCALCKQIFDSKVSIQVHFAVKHSNECRSLKCTSCSAYFRSEMEFQVHVKLNHLSSKNFHSRTSNSTTYRCLLCDQIFPNEVQLRFHTSTHKKQFTCSACGDAFHVEFLLDRHIQTVHQGIAASSPPAHQFIGHPSGSSPVPPHVIPPPTSGPTTGQQNEEAQNLCTKKSTNGNISRGEQLTSSEPIPATVSTSTPANSLQPPTNANSKSPATSRSDYRCDICDVVCTSESGLAAHRRQAHHVRMHKEHKSGNGSAGSTTVSLFCAYCNESCKSRGELENHMKAHTATPSKHKCNICDEICPSATTLAEHKLTHCKVVSGSTCIVCRVQLANEDQFLSHIQQHNTASPNTNGNGLPVPCVVCRQTLVVDVEVRMHAKFHLKNASFEPSLGTSAPCCVCSRMFDPGNLIIRASGKTSDSLPPHTYMCKECFHSKGEGESGLPRCTECNVKFETFADLDNHRRTVHHHVEDKKTYQCIKCQMSFESEADIQAHVTCHVLHEGTQHECKLCHEVLDSPSKLQCHLIEHTFEGSSHFTCYLCASVFTSSHLLQRHMLDHGLDARPYDCSECRQKFFFRAELENHSFVHIWENMSRLQASSKPAPKGQGNGESSRLLYECQKCPCVFGSPVDLAKHQQHSHGHEAGRPHFTCPSCGMEFGGLDDLRGHMILMHPTVGLVDAFPSDRGPLKDLYKFDDESVLKEKSLRSSHNKGWKEKKSFDCPVCKKKFTRKENRKLHMKSHHHVSSSKTVKKPEIKEQKRTDITSTTHPCESCEESFPSTDLLRRHLRDSHGKTFEHTCIVCNQPFENEQSLQSHQTDEHRPQVLEKKVDGDETVTLKTETESYPTSPEPSGSNYRQSGSSSGEGESNQTVTMSESELATEMLDYNGPEERTNLPAEVAA